MTSSSTRLAVPLLLLLAACGKPPTPVDAGTDAGTDGGPADAGPTCLEPADGGTDAGSDGGARDGGDFSCLGQPRPTGAVARLTVGGKVTAAGLTRAPVSGATVELFGEGGALLASATSSDGGDYQVSATIGCVPLAGYVKASAPDAGFFDAYSYPVAPWRVSRTDLELVIFDAPARNLVAGIAGVTVQSGTGALGLSVEDCAGEYVVGATVATVPAGTIRYVSANGLPSQTETATTSKGQLLVFNLPPGPVQITATAGGRVLGPKTVTIYPDSFTSTVVAP